MSAHHRLEDETHSAAIRAAWAAYDNAMIDLCREIHYDRYDAYARAAARATEEVGAVPECPWRPARMTKKARAAYEAALTAYRQQKEARSAAFCAACSEEESALPRHEELRAAAATAGAALEAAAMSYTRALAARHGLEIAALRSRWLERAYTLEAAVMSPRGILFVGAVDAGRGRPSRAEDDFSIHSLFRRGPDKESWEWRPAIAPWEEPNPQHNVLFTGPRPR